MTSAAGGLEKGNSYTIKLKKGGITCIVLKKGSSDSKETSKGMLGLQ
jgi:hypothetical protein